MKDHSKIKQELLEENALLKQRIQELEHSESARKQAENKMLESEERLRDLMFSIADWVWEVDENGVYTYSSQKGSVLFGKSRGDIIGKTPFDFMPPEEAKRVAVIFSEIVANKAPIKDLENWNINRNGERICLLTNGLPILDSDGNLKGYRGVDKDITERKRAEDALRESEEKYRAVIESANDLIAIVVDGVIMFSNPAFMSVLGYETGEVNGMKLTMFSPPENMDEVVDRYRRRMAGEKLSPLFETALLHKDGRKVLVESIGRVIQFKGKPADLIFIRNITDRKKAEEELRASRERLRSLAGRIEQVREEERVMISREIHDIMGGGLTELKLDLFWVMNILENAESDKDQAAMMGRIITSIESADNMIRVIRRISNDLRPPVLDDLGLIAALEWQLSDFTIRTGILHKFTTAFKNVDMEKNKAIAVFRIFQEILTNIIRHSGATKVVAALLEDEEISFGDENLVFEIRDNGRGIKEEEILNPKAFGLLGMKERALAFGGEFSIFGEPGVGTAVTVKIPRKQGGNVNDQSYHC